MNLNEITYWITLAFMPNMWTSRKNQLYVECYKHVPQYTITDLFENPNIRRELGVTPNEEILFTSAYQQLANNAFLVEDLLNQGYEIIPITSLDYPHSLKKNLKMSAPCVLFIKGNKELLNADSTAIVGSRNANAVSLEFTNNVARKAVSKGKIVVSGFARGVDRQALDSAINALGKSIIVLPQGITTFTSGFKQYYQKIIQGQVTVISSFHPKAPWSKELAMARNSIIYGLGTEIYVAQSDAKGGTWSGVVDGLKRGRIIYVRIPQNNELNANLLLIQKGAIGVDLHGDAISHIQPEDIVIDANKSVSITSDYSSYNTLKEQILKRLVGKKMSKEILADLNLDWTDSRMKKFLRSIPEIKEEKKSGKIYFSKIEYNEPSLFDN